jgi:hypothetical protein
MTDPSGDIAATTLCSNVTTCDADATKICSSCKGAWYCSVECQKMHYPIHRPACLATARHVSAYPGTNGAHTLVGLPDAMYAEALLRTRSERRYELIARSGEVTTVKLRRDGKLYEVPTGFLIVPLSVATVKRGGETPIALSEYGRLVLLCGNPVGTGVGHAIFYSRQTKQAHVIDKSRDVVVATVDVPAGEVICADLSLNTAGKVQWSFILAETVPAKAQRP